MEALAGSIKALLAVVFGLAGLFIVGVGFYFWLRKSGGYRGY
jgi:uncharacterized iron-regulated membrane protein